MLTNSNQNPDILSCLANLSTDEIFTPPKVANQVLDLLPPKIWSDKNARFLDPGSKTGVFLREIAKRLDKGLEKKIPNRQKRINHIFKNQLFGLAITELTALLSRRSVYCSKIANGKYSICDIFDNPQGNIRLKTRIEHSWENGHCVFCGANEENYERGEDLETHAYQFIHTENPEEVFRMKFDVIIGNPPYQLSDSGFGRSASPIYQLFVQQAKKLNPRYLIMIIPSRWFAGGKGLDNFRAEMLGDNRIRKIVDFEDASECFPAVDIAGGVCYFLWERDSRGQCEFTNVYKGEKVVSARSLNEFPTLIRYSQAIPIIHKILAMKEKSMSEQVTSRKPFGLPTNARPLKHGDIQLRWNKGEGPYNRKDVITGADMIDKWKVITSKVSYDHGGQPDKNGMRRVLSIVDILEPGVICTETYIVAGAFDTKAEAERLAQYLRTRFVRFLVAQLSFSQDITKERFLYVPIPAVSIAWTDELLYKRYGLNKEEIAFIESKISPMEGDDD